MLASYRIRIWTWTCRLTVSFLIRFLFIVVYGIRDQDTTEDTGTQTEGGTSGHAHSTATLLLWPAILLLTVAAILLLAILRLTVLRLAVLAVLRLAILRLAAVAHRGTLSGIALLLLIVLLLLLGWVAAVATTAVATTMGASMRRGHLLALAEQLAKEAAATLASIPGRKLCGIRALSGAT